MLTGFAGTRQTSKIIHFTKVLRLPKQGLLGTGVSQTPRGFGPDTENCWGSPPRGADFTGRAKKNRSASKCFAHGVYSGKRKSLQNFSQNKAESCASHAFVNDLWRMVVKIPGSAFRVEENCFWIIYNSTMLPWRLHKVDGFCKYEPCQGMPSLASPICLRMCTHVCVSMHT